MPSSDFLTLLLPGLLTNSPAAPELARQLAAMPGARRLLGWLGAARPEQAAFDAFEAGCTALEYWWLKRAGFDPREGKIGAGLAPLLARAPAPGAPVWLAELAHVQVGRDGLVLTDPAALHPEAADGAALLEAALPALAEHGAAAEAVSPLRWRIALPPGIARHTGTPDAVAGADLDAWWPRGAESRPWRKLLNDIQMRWHDAPVNAAREARGLPPVNALWLHGGAEAWQAAWPDGKPASIAAEADWQRALAERGGIAWRPVAEAVPAPGAVIERGDLADAERSGDWHAWLGAVQRLDQDCFQPIGQALANGRISGLRLVLPGHERLVTLTIERRPALLRWLPSPKHDWKRWWLPQES